MNKQRKEIILSFLHIFISIKEFLLFIKVFSKKKIIIVNSDRIGHLSLDPMALFELFVKNFEFKNKFIFLFPKKNCANPFLQKKIINLLKENSFNCFESNLDRFLSRVFLRKNKKEIDYLNTKIQKYRLRDLYLNNKFKVFSMPKTAYEEGKIYNRNYISKIKFSNKEKLRENEIVNKYNLNDERKKYICVLARDSDYLNKTTNYNSSYHDYRNSSYLDLSPVISFINEKKNSKVLRMGNIKKKLNENIFHSKHLDIYDVSKDGFEDIVLIKNCYFFICDTAGIANIATLFNIPVLRHNWIPISNSSSYRTLIIPKLIKNKVTGQFVEYKKIFKDFAKGDIYKMRSSQFYIDNELDIIDNETDILIESTKEMYKRIEFNFDFDFDDNLQKNFESWLKDYDIYNPGLLPKSFKEKYEKLIT